MIVLHHLRIGRSIFTVWLLEELGLEYELKVYHRDPATFLAPPELKRVHPLGKSPVIEDDDLVLSESGAITAYLLRRYDTEGRFAPPADDLKPWARYTQWLHYPEGSVFAPLLVKMLLQRSSQPHVLLEGYSRREIKLHLDHIAAQLGSRQFILGETFSGADFGVTYVVSLAARLGQLEPYASLQAYLKRNLDRPAYHRAIARAVE